MKTYLDRMFQSLDQLAEKLDRHLDQNSNARSYPQPVQQAPPVQIEAPFIPYTPLPVLAQDYPIAPPIEPQRVEVQEVSCGIARVQHQVCVSHQSVEVTIQRPGISIKQSYSETHISTQSRVEVVHGSQIRFIHCLDMNVLPPKT